MTLSHKQIPIELSIINDLSPQQIMNKFMINHIKSFHKDY
jgi:uncharacterized protein (DUF2249 family)